MTSAPVIREPLAARFLPRKWFYGWYIAIACACLMFVGVGVGYYGLPIFLKPLKEEHGWSTTQVSWAPAIYFFVSGLASAVVGPYIDRYGPTRFMLIGTVVNGISAAFIGLVDQLWQLYFVYFVFALAFGTSSSIAVNAIMTRWFVRKRALAMSISSTGVSLGGVILAPVASALVESGGLALATPILGALVLIVALPVILALVAWEPAQMGLHPDGDSADAIQTAAATPAMAAQYRLWTRPEAMKTVGFWAILIAFLLVLVAQTGYIIHQVNFLEERLGSRSEAAFTISVTAFGSIIARLVVGIFADGVDRRMLTVVLFVVQATAVLLIVHIENVAATWALTLVFGLTIGNIYMMQSLLVGELFGMVSFGAVFGLISFAGQAGSGIGPIGVGFLEDQTGGYTIPFTVTAVVTYLAAVAVLFARPAREAGA
ncbi:MAG: MFS transporter [Dehalococcoidia bacterium]|uniref:MFS transporter n=1 Tax=Candidatus Amarobacter glycogenicus TaxID=3140699 RepID=UPI001D8474D4|nr:MFS transporter [Dehalococcoidia bacterium]MBK6562308.1 MFS transporter [Dehalococcoidia bacterium]MBK7124498.1 MFS transporter [Dehalococcoidia bacterium]MBK7724747.1 MFS transporter [Dehalococcoidia bacterium]MBK9341820.1 MFS transporter [Dehalococcoidia bacterium]